MHTRSRGTIELTTRTRGGWKPFFLLSANVCLETFFFSTFWCRGTGLLWVRKVRLSPSRRFDVWPKTELPSSLCMTSTRQKNGFLRLLLRLLGPSRSVIQRARSCWKIFLGSARERKGSRFLSTAHAMCRLLLLSSVGGVGGRGRAGVQGWKGK